MTKGEIDRLGQRIGASRKDVSSEDLNNLQEYRQIFQKPLANVFSFVLNAARKIDRQCIVTYRIKRIDTIIEKLHRFFEDPNGDMKLSRMWDIAGCRCIMESPDNKKLYELLQVIKDEYDPDCKVNDYVAEGAKSSGYRSIHIYVKDKETQARVEIQIRNKAQHNWATLVEIVDLLYETKNKENGANSTLGRFLSLYSKAGSLGEEDFTEMLQIERRKRIFEHMSKILTRNYLNIRKQWLRQKQNGNFFIITANKKGSEILSFPTFDKAETTYYEKYVANNDSNIVLTHIKEPDFDQISMAYSNYMLAMHSFIDDYRKLVSGRIIQYAGEGAFYKFVRYFKCYESNVKCHIKNLYDETMGLVSCNEDVKIRKSQINNWVKDIRGRLILWGKETQVFLDTLRLATAGNKFMSWLVRNRIKHLSKAISMAS